MKNPKPTLSSKPLTHEERLRLIRAPYPTFRIYGGRQWGGASLFLSEAVGRVNPLTGEFYVNQYVSDINRDPYAED